MPLPKTISLLRLTLVAERANLSLENMLVRIAYDLFKAGKYFKQPLFNLSLPEHEALFTQFKRISINLSACEGALFQINAHMEKLAALPSSALCENLPAGQQAEIEDTLRISKIIDSALSKGLDCIQSIQQLAVPQMPISSFQSLEDLFSTTHESYDDDFSFSDKPLRCAQQPTATNDEALDWLSDSDDDEYKSEKEETFPLQLKLRTPPSSADELDWPSSDSDDDELDPLEAQWSSDSDDEAPLDPTDTKVPSFIKQFETMGLSSSTPTPENTGANQDSKDKAGLRHSH